MSFFVEIIKQQIKTFMRSIGNLQLTEGSEIINLTIASGDNSPRFSKSGGIILSNCWK